MSSGPEPDTALHDQNVSNSLPEPAKIRTLRTYLTKVTCRTRVQVMVISHMDYGNSLFLAFLMHVDYNEYRIFAAKVILCRSRYDTSRECLQELHWLPVKNRIVFKILCIVFTCIQGQAPQYLQQWRIRDSVIGKQSHKIEQWQFKVSGQGLQEGILHQERFQAIWLCLTALIIVRFLVKFTVFNICVLYIALENTLLFISALYKWTYKYLALLCMVWRQSVKCMFHSQTFLQSDSLCLVEGKLTRRHPTIPCILLLCLHVQQLEIGGFRLANGMYKWTKMKYVCCDSNYIVHIY